MIKEFLSTRFNVPSEKFAIHRKNVSENYVYILLFLEYQSNSSAKLKKDILLTKR